MTTYYSRFSICVARSYSGDFLNIPMTPGRVSKIEVSHTKEDLATDWSPSSQLLAPVLAGKPVWLNAQNSTEMSERLRQFHSAYLSSPIDTSACVLIRQVAPVDLHLLKTFVEVLTVPKRSSVRCLSDDEEWSVVKSPEKLRVLYLASTVDKVFAEAGLMTERILAASQKRADGSPALRMMFAARAAGTDANILFHSGASYNYVSTTFAKLTGISVSPYFAKSRLGSDYEVASNGKATVYV
jgi:hypothetical protein